MLAGIAFGNAGCHLPHAMSYAVSSQSEDLVPHGMSVILNAPSVFRYTASACPERHMEAAQLLGADTRDAGMDDAGYVLARNIIYFFKATGMPAGLHAVGYGAQHLDALADGSFPQKSLVNNAPREVSRDMLRDLYANALRYW
jgi:alcohol dehydrogenase class IV